MSHWVFDLDDTLYPPTVGLTSQQRLHMLGYVQKVYDLPPDEAEIVRRRLVAEHGTTLRGLMITKEIDPVDFLSWEDDLDLSALRPNPPLRDALARLDGPRYVFTNGSAGYGRRVLGRLGLDDLFSGVWGIDSGDYLPKPWLEAYERCFDAFGIEPASGIFVDDSAVNLRVPKDLGMATVLVNPDDPYDHDHVDVRVPDLLTWLRS
ncbi:pyrimidine 5'-nucleotidase [Microlunatus endophyticus]|uniref:pyrimidine 5'-nucleotidase n=1 Tax=Microlunatus endophyticus TaxID=1716077 RepID=UPI00166D0640|nr:pyrimidine 5'-nucleotidase [Microlunatus endophyticus]